MCSKLKQKLLNYQRSLLDYVFFRPSLAILPETAQAKTRIVVALLVLSSMLLFGMNTQFQGLQIHIFIALSSLYFFAAVPYYYYVNKNPGDFRIRRYLAIFTDIVIISLAIYGYDLNGAAFYPLYLWVSIGSGFRYGDHYLRTTTVLAIIGLSTVVLLNHAWYANLPLGFGLIAGMAIMQLFLLSLLRQLDTTKRQLQQQLQDSEYSAYHDALTHLPNRLAMEKNLSKAISNAKLNDEQIALFFIDMDSFKIVNDTFGHTAGDDLLQDVAKRLQHFLRNTDCLYRLGGDEFVVVLQKKDVISDATILASRIVVEHLAKHFTISDTDVYIPLSIGISVYPADGADITTLIKHADTALYRAKAEGGNQFCFYNPMMSTVVTEQLHLQNELRKAINNNEFVMYYQPIFDINKNQISGVEALVRWQHPQRGLLSADHFISEAENSGMIVPLGRWVLDKACHDYALLCKASNCDLTLTVNVNSKQFFKDGFNENLESVINKTEIKPENLMLEITEREVMNHCDIIHKVIDKFKNWGVRLCIDDFGTEYSSFGYLKHFPIDCLKIDKSFITDIPTNQADCALVDAMISMGKGLSIKVIAEGVENTAQFQWLKKHDCNIIQGNLVGGALSLAAFNQLLTTQKQSEAFHQFKLVVE